MISELSHLSLADLMMLEKRDTSRCYNRPRIPRNVILCGWKTTQDLASDVFCCFGSDLPDVCMFPCKTLPQDYFTFLRFIWSGIKISVLFYHKTKGKAAV